MKSVMSRNELAGWDYESMSHDEKLANYFECLIECDESAHVCKRICKEVLTPS